MQTISLKTASVTAALLCGLVLAPACPAPAQSDDEGTPAAEVTGGLLAQIGAPYIAEELRLSEEQQEGIEALLESVRETGRSAVPVPDNGGEPLTDEQKAEYRAALDRAAAEENLAAVKRLREILDETQFARLRQIWLQQIGLEGVIQPDVAEEIGLTEVQRATLEKMYAQELERNRAIPADRDPEDEQTYREEWRQQWTGELTDEQRGKWSEMLGPPLALAQVPSGDGTPSAATQPESSTAPRGRATSPRTTAAPADEETPNSLAPTGPAVASFDRDGQTEEARPGDPVKFNFEYAPWPVVLKLFADRAGYILHLKDTPPGTYTYRDPKSYTITEALDVLNGYLLQEGYVLVRRDNALVSLRVDGDQIPPNLIPEVTPDELITRGRNELVSVIFPLEPGVDVEKLRDEIYEITGPQGNAVALTTASGLYVTDTAGNLRRIYDIIKTVAPPRTPEDVVFRPYALTYLAADEAQYIVGELLGSTRTVPNVSAGGGGDSDRDRRGFPGWPQFGGDQGRGSDRDRQRGATASTTTPAAKVTAELRTNQLLVTATPAQHKVVEELVRAIDVDTSGQPVRVGSLKPYLQVYKVTTDARETAKTLSALMPPGVVVNERGDDDTVHIFGTEAQHRQVQEYLRQLEGGGGFSTVSVIPLSSKDPLTVAATLRTVFLKDGTNAPTIEPDLQGRQLIVRGSSGQIDQIRTILLSMGETGTGERPKIGNSNVLHLNISGHDSQQFLEALERAWSTTNRAPLQIIPRSSGSLIRGIRTPDNRNGRDRLQDVSPDRAPPDATSTEPAAPVRKDAAAIPGRRPDLFDVALQDSEAEAAEDDAAPAAPDAAATESADVDDEEAPDAPEFARPGLTILMQGDELIVMGRDPAALEELTSLADYLMSVMPVRTSWTIFTLQSGGADEVSNMLKLLLPDVTVSSATPTTSSTSFFGGISNSFNQLGSGLADMTGLSTLGSSASLTIIPDARLNSLFVSGPESRVLEVEQLLEVLDASEWSAGELRERRPRMIEVKHAEVVDVYERVTEIYANYLETGQNNRGRNQQNPFQMLVGGGRGGGGGAGGQENEVKLTVSADTKTNHLIVSANDALFSEIEKMVEEMDQKVFDAKRTVRLVALQHASPNLVKNAVSTLMPKVTVSGTGGGNNNNNPQFGYPGFRGGDNDDRGGSSGDDVRRMMEFRERMRQQQSQQFGGGTQAIGGPNFGGFRGFGDGGSRFGGFGGDFGGRGGDRGRGDRGR